ncbi:MAG: hypothetical protein ACYCSB_01445 [bacterium]|jgi:hypothetical protein
MRQVNEKILSLYYEIGEYERILRNFQLKAEIIFTELKRKKTVPIEFQTFRFLTDRFFDKSYENINRLEGNFVYKQFLELSYLMSAFAVKEKELKVFGKAVREFYESSIDKLSKIQIINLMK